MGVGAGLFKGTLHKKFMADAPHLIYRKQMLEVKRRFGIVDCILRAKKPHTHDEETDNQFMWHQIRQVVELICFSAIASDQARYAAKRQRDGSNQDYRSDWRAGKILEHLQKISPHFLPQPMGVIKFNLDGSKHIGDGAEDKVTLLQLKTIHETAGGHLHALNPFNTQANQGPLGLDSREQIKANIAYLKSVIWDHYKIGLEWAVGDKPQTLAGGESAWLISFGKPNSPDIQMMLASAIN